MTSWDSVFKAQELQEQHARAFEESFFASEADYPHSDARYYTKTGIEFWDDWEITNRWVTIQTVGTNDYQAAVVVSNYFTMQIFDGITNRVELSTSNLPLAYVPMRIVPHAIQIQNVYITNFSPWYFGTDYPQGRIILN